MLVIRQQDVESVAAMQAGKNVDAIAAVQHDFFVQSRKPASAERHAELVAHREVGPQRGKQGIPEIADCVQGKKARVVFLQHGEIAEKVRELPEDQVQEIEHVAETEKIGETRV